MITSHKKLHQLRRCSLAHGENPATDPGAHRRAARAARTFLTSTAGTAAHPDGTSSPQDHLPPYENKNTKSKKQLQVELKSTDLLGKTVKLLENDADGFHGIQAGINKVTNSWAALKLRTPVHQSVIKKVKRQPAA